MNKKILLLLTLGISFLLMGAVMVTSLRWYHSPSRTKLRLEREIKSAAGQLEAQVGNFSLLDLNNPSQYRDFARKLNRENDNFEILLYQNDSLVFWSNNVFPATSRFDTLQLGTQKIVLAPNGYYLIRSASIGLYRIVGLARIYSQYAYNNDYLANGFVGGYHIAPNYRVSLKKGQDVLLNGKRIFGLEQTAAFQYTEPVLYILLVFYIIFLLSVVAASFYAYMFLMHDFDKRWSLLFYFVVDVVVIRYLQYLLNFPPILYSSALFSPASYANSVFLPSMGDLFISIALLVQLVYFIYKYGPQSWEDKMSAPRKVVTASILIAIGQALMLMLVYMTQSLVFDSRIVFLFENILSLNALSHIAIVVTSLIIVFTFFGLRYLNNLLSELHIPRQANILTAIFGMGTATIIYLFIGDGWQYVVISFIINIITFIQFEKWDRYNITKMVLQAVVLSYFATVLIHVFESKREHHQRLHYAENLAESRDNLAEFYYNQAAANLQHDTALILAMDKATSDTSLNVLAHRIKNKYFTGYWDKFQVQVTLCKPGRKLRIQPANYVSDCKGYFDNSISKLIPVPSAPFLFMQKNSTDALYYLGQIDLGGFSETGGNSVFIEISSNEIWKGLGYPELLVDAKMLSSDNRSGYSYAYFYKGELIKSIGPNFYNIDNKGYRTSPASYFMVLNRYDHLVYNPNPDTQIIVSHEQRRFLDMISPFFYIFLLFLLVLGVIYAFDAEKVQRIINFDSFRLRLQAGIIGLILVSMLALIIFSLYFIIQLNHRKNVTNLTEKLNSVLVELEYRYGNSNSFDGGNDLPLQNLLSNMADTYLTDINLFGKNGMLLASSRPKIYGEHLIAGLMEPRAVEDMIQKHLTFFVQNERIGSYTFLSAYAPVRNSQNRVIGYLNLPNYARQEEIREEISSLVTAFANIYIMVILATLMLALFFSDRITQPLREIAEQFRKVKFAKGNTRLKWTRNDEIGQLVVEYNRMIDELGRTAETLARSERESAWRQMARQVAHEIKNPLTPIKLSMQLLLRAWDDQVPDWDLRLKRFSQTLVLQIDTLSSIATEFSDFAQMPEPEMQGFDIVPIIAQSAGLFRDQSDCLIEFETKQKECFVYADPNQMLRVFNNLIKNALQAIPSEKTGIIVIRLMEDNGHCLISFQDNGTGIPEEKQTRIFSPNFTTKTTGMGLGLAMVKNIIDLSGGRIWFDTEMKKGTTFFITLKLANSINP